MSFERHRDEVSATQLKKFDDVKGESAMFSLKRTKEVRELRYLRRHSIGFKVIERLMGELSNYSHLKAVSHVRVIESLFYLRETVMFLTYIK